MQLFNLKKFSQLTSKFENRKNTLNFHQHGKKGVVHIVICLLHTVCPVNHCTYLELV